MMDFLDTVREIGSEARLSSEQIERAAERLRAASERDGRRHRRLWLIGGGIGLTVAAASIAVVVALVSADPAPPPVVAQSPDPAPSATVRPEPQISPTPSPIAPTVASVTEGAAALAGSSAGSVIAAGRYLRIETRSEHLQTITPAGVSQDPFTARPDVTSAWTYLNTYVTYVPTDRTGEWVREFLPGIEIGSLYGPTAAADSQKWLKDLWHDYIVNRVQGGLYERGGGEGPAPTGSEIKFGSDEYFAQMPRDPQALLDWQRERVKPGGVSWNVAVFQTLVQDLETNIAPPDLRASMFRALALIPGLSLDSFDDEIATVAFRSPDYPGVDTVSIDAISGLVVGASVTYGSGGTVLPDSVPNNRTWTTITSVDTAP